MELEQGMADGTWNLKIYVTDLDKERVLRVKGDSHIGGVMLSLVEILDIAMDWSDHALWWPEKNTWLTRTRTTLDQYGVQADAFLHFTPMHKTLRVQLPDLRYLDCRVDFSIKTFNAVIQICKDLGIRHPEELSFCIPLQPFHLKQNRIEKHSKRNKENMKNGLENNSYISGHSPLGSQSSLDKSIPPFVCGTHSSSKLRTPPHSRTPDSGWNGSHDNLNIVYTPNGNIPTSVDKLNGSPLPPLALSPTVPSNDVRATLLRPKSLVEKARMNFTWLDSSLSIMEQGVKENDVLRLRFKFYSFYDLNPKVDSVRINQIYEQAKWQLLNDELDCTEEEALMFAALQVQICLQTSLPQPTLDNGMMQSPGDDDIDAALSELEVTLEGSHINSHNNDITRVPELYDYLRFLKPKRFTLKAYKKYWFTCRDLRLRLYKSQEDFNGNSTPVYDINLRGCEVTPDVCLTQGKYGIKLEVPGPDGMSEMYIRCDTEDQYARWMGACRLASKGRSLADSSYDAEVSSIRAFLKMQQPAPTPVINTTPLDIVDDEYLYLPPKYAKRLKGKLVTRISEAHANVKGLSLMEAKMNYIKAWQSLPDFGITLFIVRFGESRKDELLGVAFNRIMLMDINTGDLIKAWRYSTIKAWDVTWHTKVMKIQFDNEEIEFRCQSADCKVVHEFIGGYIFLSMRSKDANQTLNEELFHKLTGGWS